ncbi:unnamed protein product [Closterium sp. NIES-65]|nr:unnamed protein product [Closterium sp. NIES-65]
MASSSFTLTCSRAQPYPRVACIQGCCAHPACFPPPLFPSRAACTTVARPSFPLPLASRPSPKRPSSHLVACGLCRCRAPLISVANRALPFRLCSSLLPFPLRPSPFLRLLPHLDCWLLISSGSCTIRPFTLLLLSSLPSFPSPSLSLSSASHLSSATSAGYWLCFLALLIESYPSTPSASSPSSSPLSLHPLLISSLLRLSPLLNCCCWLPALLRRPNYSAAMPPPHISPLNGATADYSAVIPPPLISPLSGAAANYSAAIPPLLISPLRSAAGAEYSAVFSPPLISPLNGSAAD